MRIQRQHGKGVTGMYVAGCYKNTTHGYQTKCTKCANIKNSIQTALVGGMSVYAAKIQ